MAEALIETEETLIIETPERVPLEFALASIGNRFLAVLIDHFIQFLSIFLALLFFSWILGVSDSVGSSNFVFASNEAPKWILAVFFVVMFLLFTSYFTIFEWIWNGQTPGKKLMKLRVIREDGRPITLWEAISRNLLRTVDAIPGFFIPIYSIGLIVVFLNNRDQRVGDIFSGTVVIRERIDEAPSFDEAFANEVRDTAIVRVYDKAEFKIDISLLNDAEVEVVENFLRRRFDLADRQRLWMAWRVALPLMYKLKPQYDPENFSYEGFLEELFHLYNSRKVFFN